MWLNVIYMYIDVPDVTGPIARHLRSEAGHQDDNTRRPDDIVVLPDTEDEDVKPVYALDSQGEDYMMQQVKYHLKYRKNRPLVELGNCT